MSLRYTCFISYRHMASPGATAMIDAIHRQLSDQVELYLGGDAGIYYDKTRLSGGDYFTPALARALCESSCMIMLYNPGYFAEDNTFCAREYTAMLHLEAERRHTLGVALENKSLIIPVVLRAAESLPEEVKSRTYVSLVDESTHVRRLQGIRVAQKFRDLAEIIFDRYEIQRAAADSLRAPCPDFALPEPAEVQPLIASAIALRQPRTLPYGGRP